MEREIFGDVYLSGSRIEGTGAFASRAFKKGEWVLAVDDSRVVTDKEPLDPAKGENDTYCDWLPSGKVVLLKKPESHVNSSCDPNVYIKTLDGARRMVAIRDIAADEEITADYMPTIFGGKPWVCRCGASNCRKENPASFSTFPWNGRRGCCGRWTRVIYGSIVINSRN